MKQKYISKNSEIHDTIKQLLTEAEKSIKVATAWFTDKELFDILVEKAKEGLTVEVVIADKEDNNRLDFSQLELLGAKFMAIDVASYGMMHLKCCVIDESKALIGSYNWTINAKKHNKEGVVLTSDQETITQMVKDFDDLIRIPQMKKIKQISPKDENNMKVLRAASNEERTLESLFNEIIESEVVEIDLGSIREKGRLACKETLGSVDTFLVYLDKLKLQFKTDLTLSDDKKAKILSSIEELSAKEINIKEKSFDKRIDTIISIYQEEKAALEKQLKEIDEKVVNNNAEQDKINLNKIETKKNQITLLKEKLIELKADLKVSSIAWYDLMPKVFLGLGLGGLVYLFYSSAIYIMLFTGADFQTALFNGEVPETPTFFDAGAIGKAIEKGGTAVLFVCLIPVFFFFFAFLKRFTKGWKKWQEISLVVGVVVFIDGVIAYIVAETIHYSKYLNNEVQTPGITLSDAITDLNFLSVLICGVITLLTLKAVVTSIWKDLDSQNMNHVANELKIEVDKISGQIDHYNQIINEGQTELIELKTQLEIFISDKTELENKLSEKQNIKDSKVKSEENLNERELSHLIKLSDFYTARVENENLLFDVDFLDQRINSFIEGWDEFLYDHYSQLVADEKVKEVKQAYDKWIVEQKRMKKVA